MRARPPAKIVRHIHAEALQHGPHRQPSQLPSLAEWEQALAAAAAEAQHVQAAREADDDLAEVEVRAASAAGENACPEDAWAAAARPLAISGTVATFEAMPKGRKVSTS